MKNAPETEKRTGGKITQDGSNTTVLNKLEWAIYKRLAKTAEEIKLYREGKMEFQDANEFLAEL